MSTRINTPAEDIDDRAIRVGREYQAVVPKGILYPTTSEYKPPPRLANPRLVWSPAKCSISDEEVNTFVQNALASVTHALQVDQVLGILHWNEYNVTAAMADVQKYCCHPDSTTDWSREECTLFERAFEKYRKNFRKIAKLFPSRNTRSIVRYYYHWKKTRRTDKKIQSLALEEPSRQTLDDMSDDEDIDTAAQSRRGRRTGRGSDGPATCSNCGLHADEDEEATSPSLSPSRGAAALGGVAAGNGSASPMLSASPATPQRGRSSTWRLRQADCAHLCKSCTAFWRTWGRDKPIKVSNGHNGYSRPSKRPKLDFGEPATEVALRVTLPMTTALLDAEMVRLQAPPVDGSYLERRKQQLEVEAELQLYQLDIPAVARQQSQQSLPAASIAAHAATGAGAAAGTSAVADAAAAAVAAALGGGGGASTVDHVSSNSSARTVATQPEEGNGWTRAIIATFIDGLAIHGKNFHRISKDMLDGSKSADELRAFFKARKGVYGFDAQVKVYFDRLRGIGVRAAGNLGIKAADAMPNPNSAAGPALVSSLA